MLSCCPAYLKSCVCQRVKIKGLAQLLTEQQHINICNNIRKYADGMHTWAITVMRVMHSSCAAGMQSCVYSPYEQGWLAQLPMQVVKETPQATQCFIAAATTKTGHATTLLTDCLACTKGCACMLPMSTTQRSNPAGQQRTTTNLKEVAGPPQPYQKQTQLLMQAATLKNGA